MSLIATPAVSQQRSKFIVVIGIDGSGKSTLLADLRLPGVVSTDWRELRNHELSRALAPQHPTHLKRDLAPLSRAMFIGGHLVAQYEQLVRPRLIAGSSVVLDSYYYKLLAKEELYGTSHLVLADLCQELPQPDCVIFIDVAPVVSYRRKQGRLSPYEYLHTPCQSDYTDFQRRLREAILQRIADVPAAYQVSGEQSPARLRTQVTSLISRHLAGPEFTEGVRHHGHRYP